MPGPDVPARADEPGRIVLPGHAAERLGLDRRRFLRAAGGSLGSLGALRVLGGLGLEALLAACDAQGPAAAQGVLRAAERMNERVERLLFRHTAMDRPRAGAALAGNAFPSYFVSDAVPAWDEAERGPWTLEVSGLVRRPLRLTLPQLVALPRVMSRLDHFCVEGWTAVSIREGVRLSELARLAGALPQARYVDFQSFDDGYHESWDIDSAMHPQTLVVYAQDGHYLGPAYGAPARIYSPVKLGYKNTKYLTRIVFAAERNGGYWTDRGYEWYGGV